MAFHSGVHGVRGLLIAGMEGRISGEGAACILRGREGYEDLLPAPVSPHFRLPWSSAPWVPSEDNILVIPSVRYSLFWSSSRGQ